MVKTASQSLTLEEFLQLPETKPVREYIEGKIIQKPMPKGKHSSIQTELATTINATLRGPKIARAFSELRCTFSGQSIVPDVSVFVWTRIPRDENGEVANIFTVPPDWIVEILSPEQSQTKVTKKILETLKQGSQMGWLIDPQEKTIFVYHPQQQPEFFDKPEQEIPVPAFASELRLTIANIFDWLLE
jgi:Uma2 family endonuclease